MLLASYAILPGEDPDAPKWIRVTTTQHHAFALGLPSFLIWAASSFTQLVGMAKTPPERASRS